MTGRIFSVDSRVIGGSVAKRFKPHRFRNILAQILKVTVVNCSAPFMISLQKSGAHFCGGSIISADFGVSAAHW